MNNLSLSDFDVCYCGDYRRDHKDGKGACSFNSPSGVGHPGGLRCYSFKLAKAAHMIPEHIRKIQENDG